jgi:hypothetical protein
LTFAFSVSTVVVAAIVAATAASVGIGIPTPPIVERPRAASVIAVVIAVASGKTVASDLPFTDGGVGDFQSRCRLTISSRLEVLRGVDCIYCQLLSLMRLFTQGLS